MKNYHKLKSANKKTKTLKESRTLKKFEIDQLGAMARIKY